MSKEQTLSLLNDRPEVVARLAAFTFYDLTAVSEIIWSMLYDQPDDAPAFPTPPPSESALFFVNFEDKTYGFYTEVFGHRIECDIEMYLKLQAYYKAFQNLRDAAIRKFNSMSPEQQKLHPFRETKVDPLRRPHSATFGQPLSKDDFELRLASVCCELIAQQNLVNGEARPAPRHLRRRLRRDHGITLRPIVMVDFCRTVGMRIEAQEPAGIRKALHYVSGHWRSVSETTSTAVLVEGRPKVWVHSHWRGDPALGVITKGYKAGSKFAAGLEARALKLKRSVLFRQEIPLDI